MRVRKRALRLTAGVLLLVMGGPPSRPQTAGASTDRGQPIDLGYDWAPRGFGRGGNYEDLLFCRFVGDPTKPHIQCSFHGRSRLPHDPVDSGPGIDRGYDWGPRAFVDVSGDQRLDFCRLVGDPHTPHMACLLAGKLNDANDRRFVDDQYGYQGPPFKAGQTWVGSGFGDVNGDNQADFCYFEDPATSAIACLMAKPSGFTLPQRRFWNDLRQGSTRADLPWGYQDVTADGRADFCHFIDSEEGTLLQCLSETMLFALQPGSLDSAPRAGASGVRVYARAHLDLGHDSVPRGFADADGDKIADYCRFVGDRQRPSIACATNLFANGDQYALRSDPVDAGRPELPRGFLDIDYNNRADYCRFVEGPPAARIRCAVAQRGGSVPTSPYFTDEDLQ